MDDRANPHGEEHAAERLRALIETIPATTYVCEWDERATIRWISPQVEQLLGYPPEAWLTDQDLWHERVHDDDREAMIAEEVRAFRAAEPFDMEYRMVAADGSVVWVWDREAIVRDHEGRPVLSQGVLLDVTGHRVAAEETRAERDRAQRYLDVAGAMIVIATPDARIQLVNRAFIDVLGYREEELIGRSFGILIPPEERKVAAAAFARVLEGDEQGAFNYEGVLLRKDGEERTVRWRNTLVRDEDGTVTATLSSGEDVTERRAAEEQVAWLAYHDALTSLPNRSLLREHLELAVARGRRHNRSAALLYLDLNNFKLVNDSLGHAAGDEVLELVAKRLRALARESEVLARHGGDEFLLLLTDLENDGAEAAAEGAAAKLNAALEEPFRISGTDFQIGAAIGISLFPTDAEDPDRLLQHADAAMYEAKRAGRVGPAVYSSGPRRNPLDRLSMTARLHWALERDELELHYQPIVRLADGGIERLEALLRWREPREGLLLPAEYIALAEDTGLIGPIGDWVLGELCRQTAAWRDGGHTVPVSFNVSPVQLRSVDFATRVRRALEAHRLDPGLVCVEITETAAMRDLERAESALQELRAVGVLLAVDDFGAAHSSLTRLRSLPADMLKVDRSFLEDVPDDPGARAMLSAIVGMGLALGMRTVAEGVETEAQRQFLIAEGCPLAQGFALGRPQPAALALARVA